MLVNGKWKCAICNMSDGNLTAMCSFDITKCFDTINHSILLKKMEYYGMQSENIKWFKSYLNEREQMVRVIIHYLEKVQFQ